VLQRRKFLFEERTRVGDVLVEGSGKCPFQRGTVARPTRSAQERVYRPGLVTGSVKLDSSSNEGSRRRSAGH
jgi:hypothetical protein